MSMTVDQIILLSRLFLGAMIILTIVAEIGRASCRERV